MKLTNILGILFIIGKKCVLINRINKISKLYYSSRPRTDNQIHYEKALKNEKDNILVVNGPAGTGKTFLACNTAIQFYKQKKIEKIVLTRPVVPVEEDIGFLPGSINKKMDPWTRPLFDVFEEHYSKKQVNDMLNTGIIEISPLTYMRGRTFKNSFIIADEMQNSSPNQMFMCLTRIGVNSRMVITGDLEQSDKMDNNGLKDFINRYKSLNYSMMENIKLIQLNKNDVQRSKLVSDIIGLYSFTKNKSLLVTIDNKNMTKSLVKVEDNDAALIPRKHLFRFMN